MKRIAFVCIALVSLLIRPVLAQDEAAGLKPIAVLCLSSYQNAMDDLKYVGGLLKDDIYPTRFNAMLGLLLNAEGLKVDGLTVIEPTKPLGMAIVTDGQAVVPIAMVPLAEEPEKFFEAMKPLTGDAMKQDNGIFALGQGILAGFAKAEGGWLYLSQIEEHLQGPLPDPVATFGDLPASYDLGARMIVANVPDAYRTIVIDQMRIVVEGAAQPQEGESEALFNFRREIARLQSLLVDRGFGESEQITFGMKIDAENNKGTGDVIVVPTAGTQFADHIAELKGLKTRYGKTSQSAGETEVLTAMNMTGPLDKSSIDEYVGLANAYRAYTLELIEKSDQVKSDEERTTLKELAGSLVDVVRATIEAGQLDVAVRMTGKGTQRSLVFAGRVSDADKLKATVEKIGELAATDPGFAAVKMNEAEHEGVGIHSFKLKPDPKSQEGQLAKFFGNELRLLVAVKDDNLWLGVGPGALDLVKASMELGETETPPLQGAFRLGTLMSFGIQLLNQPQLSTFGSMLTSLPAGKDLTTVVAQPTPEGNLHVHIETEQGVVKLGGAIFGQFGPIIMNMVKQQQSQ